MKRQPGLYFCRDRRFWSGLDWRCPGWTGNAWAGLDPFEWAELQFSQSAWAGVTVFEGFSGLETAL
ncbi:unnamed protein product [Prunus armeniaca]